MKSINLQKILLWMLVVGVLGYCYRSIFLSHITSAGDLPYYWNDYIQRLEIAELWNPHWPTGLGGNQAIVLPLKLYFQLPIVLFVQPFSIPWELIQRIVFFWAFFILSIYSSYRLTRSWIGSLIYASNTWILMVFSGGQIGVALGYSIAPLILLSFMQFSKIMTLRMSIIAGLLLSIQFLFDVRIMYVTLLAVGVYFLLNISNLLKRKDKKNLLLLFVPFILTGLLHSFWLFPLITTSSASLSPLATLQPTLKEVVFFSFATFSNTMGLLHPNWPENIFGKVGFMKPEFLILPLFAFASLLFVQYKTIQAEERKRILFFALVGLLGIFLAKGANEPVGVIYLWLFEHIPGFTLFRDPTKFYVLVALAYSFLIPQTITQLSILFAAKLKKKKYLLSIVSICFIIYWCFLLRPVFFNQIGGLFKEHEVPREYVQLQEFLSSQKQFSRTFWIPQSQRFGYFSDNHPLLNGSDIATEMKAKDALSYLKKKDTLSQLQQMSVRYVILPYDSSGEIYLKDRIYSETNYQHYIAEVKRIAWLTEKKHFGKLIVFEVPDPKDHFWIQSNRGTLAYQSVDPTKYLVLLRNVKKGDKLIYSESYSPQWIATENETNYSVSKPFASRYNSFDLPHDGQYTLKVLYRPQQWTDRGLLIGLTTLIVMIAYLVRTRRNT